MPPEEAENLRHKTRLAALDALSAPRLGKISAREAGGDDVYLRQGPQVPYVANELRGRKSLGKHGPGGLPALAQELGLTTSARQTTLDAADPGEQAGNGEPGGGTHGTQTTTVELAVERFSAKAADIE